MKTVDDNRAFALPTLLIVMTILLLIATAIGQLGFSNLHLAQSEHDANEALFASEAGLVEAAERLKREGEINPVFEQALPNGASYKVRTFVNDTTSSMETVRGVRIPVGTTYLHSLGTSANGRTRETGLLLKKGFGFFQVGALGQGFNMDQTNFDAFSSEQSDYPASIVNDAMIAASNSDSGTIFELNETDVHGGLFVGVGGDASSSISADASSNIARQGSLTEPIEVPTVVVPDLSGGDGGDDSGDDSGDQSLTFPNVPNFRVERVGDELHLTYEESGRTEFQMVVQENGDFTIDASAPFNGTESAIGNIQQGWGTITQSAGQDTPTQLIVPGDNAFYFRSRDNHRIVGLDADGNLSYSQGGASDTVELPGWAFGTGGPPSLTNPDLLTGGEYENVTINADHQTELQSGETFVVENLEITSGGAIALPSDAETVSIYVKNRLVLDGDDTVLNDTRRAPKLNIFYLGDEKVELRGGSRAYFTLFAPDADIELSGTAQTSTDFFGALVGRNIELNHANFHFDLATMGIGQGGSGERYEVVAKPRY